MNAIAFARNSPRLIALAAALLLASSAFAQEPPALLYQPPLPTLPPTANDQRNALNNVVSQISYFRNVALNAPNFSNGSFLVWDQFRRLRILFTAFESTLTAGQADRGADALAELEEGLVIIQQALDNLQIQIRTSPTTFFTASHEYRVLVEAINLWYRRFNQIGGRLLIGR